MNSSSSQSIKIKSNNTDVYPLELLTNFSNQQITGCLQLFYDSFTYSIYLYRGKIAYATNSLEPFERLERHLRRLSHNVPNLKGEIRNSIRLIFDIETDDTIKTPGDYQAISWLLEQEHINKKQAIVLITRMIKEVFETYLLLSNQYKSNIIKNTKLIEPIEVFELVDIAEKCQKEMQKWYSYLPYISSSYQRPYFFSKPGESTEKQKIGKILRGFNFRQLAAILNQDELLIVKKFFPLIANKTIVIHDPQSPFDLLPRISRETISIITKTQTKTSGTQDEQFDLNEISSKNIKQQKWKIVCIDDSPTILNEISRFLAGDEFSVHPISEPLKALMKIIRIKPDLILLDVGMPNIDGYKLCSLIRKYSAFQNTPIVMVTGNKGLIDRAKARMAGASDYMTKPFTQSDLLNIVFRYLS
ncbi:MAG: response regulator [Pleurocapsa sp.]